MKFLSTTIPYVNASPHVGFAQEVVIADALARSAPDTFFLSGTDENSLKNVLAAETAGVPIGDFVAARAAEFEQLKSLLGLSYDDFYRTSIDPRHLPAVTKLWHACRANGDIYDGAYEGLYCVGCEQFYQPIELDDGLCPEHQTAPEAVAERNYFFRLSRYQDALIELIESDDLAIKPKTRKNEVLAFLREPLADLSISRSTERAHGWGIPVPDDPTQVVYVWFDALANYIGACGYETDAQTFDTRWRAAEKVTHVIGKGVARFHAVYWPAILLSAGVRLPDEILVHGYVTVDGAKISKSLANGVDPRAAAARLGVDAFRYYLLRHVGSHKDGDFSWDRLEEAYTHELCNQLGNLLSRVLGLTERHGTPSGAASQLTAGLQERVDAHIANFAVHRALDEIWNVIIAANAYLSETEPWKLDDPSTVLADALGALDAVGRALAPFLPETSRKILERFPGQLFPRLVS